jgi:hypothetical protein
MFSVYWYRYPGYAPYTDESARSLLYDQSYKTGGVLGYLYRECIKIQTNILLFYSCTNTMTG